MASATERYRLALEQGRKPTYDIRGNIRGFRSVPGAAPSSRNMGSVPREDMLDPASDSGLTDESVWARSFPKSVTAQRMNRNKAPATSPAPRGRINYAGQSLDTPVSPSPAAPGSMTTAPTEMPPPGAWANPSSWLAPEKPGNVADMATVSSRAYSQPLNADTMHNSAIERNRAALARAGVTLPSTDPTYKNDSMGPGSRFVSGKYGWASSQTGAMAAAERKRNVDKYRNSLDSMLGGFLA